MKEEKLSPETMVDDEHLPPHETPWEEFVRIFRKDRIAVAGCIVLAFLLVAAMAGKVLTEWVVVFDAEVVRVKAQRHQSCHHKDRGGSQGVLVVISPLEGDRPGE